MPSSGFFFIKVWKPVLPDINYEYPPTLWKPDGKKKTLGRKFSILAGWLFYILASLCKDNLQSKHEIIGKRQPPPPLPFSPPTPTSTILPPPSPSTILPHFILWKRQNSETLNGFVNDCEHSLLFRRNLFVEYLLERRDGCKWGRTGGKQNRRKRTWECLLFG